jgi:hypothetical protein
MNRYKMNRYSALDRIFQSGQRRYGDTDISHISRHVEGLINHAAMPVAYKYHWPKPDAFVFQLSRSYEHHQRILAFDEALVYARRYQLDADNHGSTWLLCGSLALMAAGSMPMGYVSDIDFVTNSFPMFFPIRDENGCCYDKSGMYYHYEFEYDVTVDLFVHKNTVFQQPGKYYGMCLQRISDMLFWKNKYNRKKDRNDLIQIHLNDELFEI